MNQNPKMLTHAEQQAIRDLAAALIGDHLRQAALEMGHGKHGVAIAEAIAGAMTPRQQALVGLFNRRYEAERRALLQLDGESAP